MKTVFRFSRQKETLPTTWTYPETGEYEGAQVWQEFGSLQGGSVVDVLENGGSPTGWSDGFDYSPSNGYHHLLIIDVKSVSGESGPLAWEAITEDDIERVWMCTWDEAKAALEELAWDLADEEADGIDPHFPKVSQWDPWETEERIADALKAVAEKVTPRFARTITNVQAGS